MCKVVIINYYYKITRLLLLPCYHLLITAFLKRDAYIYSHARLQIST